MGARSPTAEQAGGPLRRIKLGIDPPQGRHPSRPQHSCFRKCGVPGRRPTTAVLIIVDFTPASAIPAAKSATRCSWPPSPWDANAATLPGQAGPGPAAGGTPCWISRPPAGWRYAATAEGSPAWILGQGIELLGHRTGGVDAGQNWRRVAKTDPHPPAPLHSSRHADQLCTSPLPVAAGLRLGGGALRLEAGRYTDRKFNCGDGPAICQAPISASDPLEFGAFAADPAGALDGLQK